MMTRRPDGIREYASARLFMAVSRSLPDLTFEQQPHRKAGLAEVSLGLLPEG